MPKKQYYDPHWMPKYRRQYTPYWTIPPSVIGTRTSQPEQQQEPDEGDNAVFDDDEYNNNDGIALFANVESDDSDVESDDSDEESEEGDADGAIDDDHGTENCHNIPPLLTANDRAMLGLIQLCDNAKTPLYFLDRLIRLLKQHTALGFDVTKAPSRSKFMQRLKTKVPHVKATDIPTPPSCLGLVVTKFSMMDQLQDLFSSKYFQSEENCCVNPDEQSRFLRYTPPPSEGLSEVLGGKWYQQTYDKVIGDSPTFTDMASNRTYHNWLVPVIFYNDKTGVSAMEGSYSLEPLMFTLGVIKRTYRENDDAWRHLGFIPAIHSNTAGLPKESLAVTHECLQILLADLAELQSNPPLLTLNLFGGRKYHVRVLLEVAFVIGDQLSQDTHCCRKKINGGGAGRIHRSCMTSFLHASTIQEGGCTPISKRVLDQLCESIWLWEEQDKRDSYIESVHPRPVSKNARDKLESKLKITSQVARAILEKTFSTYPIHNAWTGISFGANEDGIYRGTLDDPMHYNSSGLFHYLAEVSFKGLIPSEAKELEQFMREDNSKRSSVRYDLPRGKFSPGFTNCTLLTASEKVGLMFALYLGLGTPRISRIFQKSILRQQKKYIDMSCFEQGCTSMNMKNSSSRLHGPPSLNDLPKVVDRYLQSTHTSSVERNSTVLPRTRQMVRSMVYDLHALGLLQVVEPLCFSLDKMQTEFLLRAIWSRVTYKNPQNLPDTRRYDDANLNRIAETLFHKWQRKHQTRAARIPTDISTIQTTIEKHGVDKPKINGRGDTSAILTDVNGLRVVLEHALLFHATVHEFNQLEPKHQTRFVLLQSKLECMMNSILPRIYRGDNSSDVATCKCHAHFHLMKDIEYYGDPMGFDASKGERNLKAWAKHISKTARKCGQQTFVRQTANRVSDHQLIKRVENSFSALTVNTVTVTDAGAPNDGIDADMATRKWKHTRKKCHMRYNLQTKEAALEPGTTSYGTNAGCHKLLTPNVTQVLHTQHGDVGFFSIWKEIRVDLDGEGGGYHYVRAFRDFDSSGHYFDWVHLIDRNHEKLYRPAMVVLLYCFQEQHYALVWKTKPAADAETSLETNLSARWKMDLQVNGLPRLVSVPIDDIEKCIYVHEHWRCRDGNHLPTTALRPGDDRSMFVVDEVYERSSWALNFIDDQRWQEE